MILNNINVESLYMNHSSLSKSTITILFSHVSRLTPHDLKLTTHNSQRESI